MPFECRDLRNCPYKPPGREAELICLFHQLGQSAKDNCIAFQASKAEEALLTTVLEDHAPHD